MKSQGDITRLCRSVRGDDSMFLTGAHKLDAPEEPLGERCARICRIGRLAMGVRVAAVTLFSGDRQRFQAVAGWRVSELSLADSLCLGVRESGSPLIVHDLSSDPGFSSARLVEQGPMFRFYAGYPLRDSTGSIIGTFCVFDVVPKAADKRILGTLTDLGQLAERELRTADLWDAQNQLMSKLGEARRDAMLDGLTGVWNRRGGMELLRMMVDRARETFEEFAVCMVDVDFFKSINDRHGHTAGDRALRNIAAAIADSARPNDIVVRYGGDEFMLILRDSGPRIARSVASRISERLGEFQLPGVESGEVPTLSFGIAVNVVSDKLTARQLIDRADKALYRTKHQGRAGMTIWSGDMRAAAHGSVGKKDSAGT